MTPESMAMACAAALNDGTGAKAGVTFVLPKGWKRPPKFPRGELLSEIERGGRALRVYSFNPMHVLAWLGANGLIKVTTVLKTPNAK